LPVLRDLLPESYKHPHNPGALNALAAAAPQCEASTKPATP